MLHDLSDDPQAIDRAAQTAQMALGQYQDFSGADVTLLNVSENATFLVQLPSQPERFVMRVHRGEYHTEIEIKSELLWSKELRRSEGIRTPNTIRNRHGSEVTAVTTDSYNSFRYCVLFEFLPGHEAVSTDLVAEFEVLGELTAKMHRHARTWNRPAWFSRFDWNLDASFGDEARWGRWQDGIGVGAAELGILGSLEGLLGKRLMSYGNDSSKYGLIHADLRLANLLWTSSSDVSVIDFDDCGNSWYFYDLGSALSFIEDDPLAHEYIDSWLTGYRSVMPVDPTDENELWTFILFRRLLLLAWIGSHQSAEIARDLGPNFTAVTCDLAEMYLSAHTK